MPGGAFFDPGVDEMLTQSNAFSFLCFSDTKETDGDGGATVDFRTDVLVEGLRGLIGRALMLARKALLLARMPSVSTPTKVGARIWSRSLVSLASKRDSRRVQGQRCGQFHRRKNLARTRGTVKSNSAAIRKEPCHGVLCVERVISR